MYVFLFLHSQAPDNVFYPKAVDNRLNLCSTFERSDVERHACFIPFLGDLKKLVE